MEDFSAELHRSPSDELRASAAAAATSATSATSNFTAPGATATTSATLFPLPPSAASAEYVDIDVSQPAGSGSGADSALSHGVMRVEQHEDGDGTDDSDQRVRRHWPRDAHSAETTTRTAQAPHGRSGLQADGALPSERAMSSALSSGNEQRSHQSAASGTGTADEEEDWAREEEDEEYNDAVLSSRLDAVSGGAANATSSASSFSYSTLTSYIPSSLSTLPSSLSSLPSSLSSLPSTLSSLPSHLPSLASLPSLPTTIASSASPAPVPLVTFKSISSFTYASDVYYMLLLATSSSLVLYHIDPNPRPGSSYSSSVVVKRVSTFHDEAMSQLSSACFLTPSVSLLSSPDLLLPSPLTPPGHLGPLLALTSSASSASSSSFPSSSVRIYSTFLSKAVHLLRFRSRVLRVVASTATLAVLLDNEIVVYATPQSASVEELRFDLLYSVRCAGGSEYGVCALGPRWIAYASEALPTITGLSTTGKAEGEDSPLLVATSTTPKVVPGSAAVTSSPFALPPSASSSVASPSSAAASLLSSLPSSSDSLSTISRNIASSLYNLGDQGRRSISNYLTPLPAESDSAASSPSTAALSSPVSASPSASSAVPSTVSAGTVIVRDVLTQRILCHLKAHSSAIAALAFDPTGTLLVTAGQHGQYIHVYQLMTLPSSSPASSPPSVSSPTAQQSSFSPRFLYRLFRGVTHATLRSLSFSSDSHWFTCTSLKGTTHIFAINPHGGPINVSTHAPPPVPVREDRDEREDDGVRDHPLTLNAIHRIRGNFPSSATTSPVSSCFLHLSLPASASHIDHLALLTSTAEVLLYRLSTVYRPPPPTAANSLALLSSAQQHRRRKETVVGEGDSIGQMMGGALEGMGVVVGHVVQELGKAVKNYQSVSTAVPAYEPSTAAAEESSQRKLDLVVAAVAHIHLAADVTGADGVGSSSRRSRDNDSGGGGDGGGGTSGGGRDRRVAANPNFFREVEQQRHTRLSRSSGHSSPTSSSPPSHSNHTASAWLANVELRPYSSPELPLWASPQFTLYSYTAPSPSPATQPSAAFGSSAHSASSSSRATSDSESGDSAGWYSEPSASALPYDKYAGLTSVRVLDGSSLGYTEVTLEEEQVEWTDSHTPAQQQLQQQHHTQYHTSPYGHSYHAAFDVEQHAALTSRLPAAPRTVAQRSVEGVEQRGGRGVVAGGGKQESHHVPDEHKAAGAYDDSEEAAGERLTRRVSRFAVKTGSGYSPPLSAMSHRSLSPSISDRDSDEQLVM